MSEQAPAAEVAEEIVALEPTETVVYQYKLRPTPEQVTAMENALHTCRLLYNEALGERTRVNLAVRLLDLRLDDEGPVDADGQVLVPWIVREVAFLEATRGEAIVEETLNLAAAVESVGEEGRPAALQALYDSVDASAQRKRLITEARKTNPYRAALNVGCMQQTIARLDLAFKAFYRQLREYRAYRKQGIAAQKPGYPRFKHRRDYNTMNYNSLGNGCAWRVRPAGCATPDETPEEQHARRRGTLTARFLADARAAETEIADAIAAGHKHRARQAKGRLAAARRKLRDLDRVIANAPSIDHPPQNARVYFQGIGEVCLYYYRPLPEGAEIRNLSWTRKPDGWWVNVIVRKPAPVIEKRAGPEVAIAIIPPLGYATSDGELIEPPTFYQDAQDRRTKAQHRMERRRRPRGTPSSEKYIRAVKLHGLHEQHIARQRKQQRYLIINALLDRYATVYYEVIRPRELITRPKPKRAKGGKYLPNLASAKAEENKDMTDLGWYAFAQCLERQASLQGATAIPIEIEHPDEDPMVRAQQILALARAL